MKRRTFISGFLFSIFLLNSVTAVADMVCSGVLHQYLDGICVTGPDNAGVSEHAEMAQQVAGEIAEVYGGGCKTVSGRGFRIYVRNCTKKKRCEGCTSTFYVINYPTKIYQNPVYFVTAHPQGKPGMCEGDPCDPATGKVFLRETDIEDVGHGLSFARYYQSNAMNEAKGRIGFNWRHSYSSQIDAPPDPEHLHRLPIIHSGYYATREEACLQGGESIKASLYAGKVADAVFSYANNTCALSAGGQVVAQLVIQVANTEAGPSLTAITHDIIRANGDTYHFRYENGAWINEGSPSIQLVEEGEDWVLTLADRSTEVYGPDGHLKYSSASDGKKTHYQYVDGLLQTVTGPFGHTLNFSYTQGRIVSVTGPDGTVTYDYDTYGNLIQVTYPDNSVRKYLYDDFYHVNSLTGIVDENDHRIATWTYDPQGRVVMNERAEGAEHYEFTYNEDGTTTVSDGQGGTRTYRFDLVKDALKFVQVTGDRCDTCGHADDQLRSYDAHGHIASRTDWNGVTTSYTRDATGHELSRTEASGTEKSRTITTEWHGGFNKPVRITEPGRITEFRYDDAGHLLSKSEIPVP